MPVSDRTTRRLAARTGATAMRGAARKIAAKAAARGANPDAPGRSPDRTVEDIIAVATEEFASKGLAGARIDEIALRMATSKRTIYYHFGGKEGLYLAVLEEAYRRMRGMELAIDIEHLEPEEALRRLAAFTFDYQNANPDFVRLVMNENIHNGAFLRQSKEIQRLNVPAIDAVRRIYERGVESGAFRAGLDPVDLHMSISALAFFNVSNRHTFSLIFKRDVASAASLAARRDNVSEMILRYVRA
jgi:AcrR family transcriptional regulator